MSDAFTPQVRELLDRLEPPVLSAGFADRVIAQAQATPAVPPLPPLPPLRKARAPARRRVAVAIVVVGLVSAAAAAAMVPADAWRRIPLIGEIVELISPAPNELARAPAESAPAPAVSEVSEAVAPETVPPAEPAIRSVAETADESSPAQDREVTAAPRAEAEPSVVQPEPIERTRDTLDPPAREIVAERAPARETQEATATVADTRVEPAPERRRPADTSDTRQQIRERATETRQTTRERTTATRDRIERRTSR